MAHVALLLDSLLKRAQSENLPAWVIEAFTELYVATYKTAFQDGKNDAHQKEWTEEEE